jgi:hypothetical protein
MKSSIPRLFWLFLLGFILIPGLAAQDTSSLTGTVTDSTGAVVSGARVVLTNPSTGTTRKQVTNSAGQYVAAALQPGTYDLTVTAPGFRTYKTAGVVLSVASNFRIDVTLQVGGVTSEHA